MRLLRVLAVGGSDSSAGAGIQADLKTFTALGVSPAVAITAVTAQNAFGVEAIYEVPASVVEAQLRAVLAEGEVAFAKTGMLFSAEIVKVVADFFSSHGIKFVLDPVLRAGSGISLLKQDAFKALVERLLPLSAVVTPNVSEAEAISGVKIETVEDAREAAVRIAEKGARAVVVKGGHLHSEIAVGRSTDILYIAEKEEFAVFEGDFLPLKRAHGAGCTFSAALAVALAKGLALKEAVAFAKKFVRDALKFSISVTDTAGEGRSVSVVNPAGAVRKNAEWFYVLENLKEALRRLAAMKDFRKLIPEVGANLGMATEDAESEADVAAVDGRMTRTKHGFRVGSVEFGASSHVARAILTMMRFNRAIRSAINIKYSPEIVEICERLFSVASFEREKEPNASEEGKTMEWGISSAVQNALKERGSIPDVIFDCGAVGKEPMLRIFGRDAVEVVEKVSRILNDLR
ncbi:MAG: bifunctional hydroxymethylpyrimidine kinase/phosphomethylpyrimidine kinase [Candidatus Methanospirare jalkutatii]|nr:MAG: bifunctional hydroxymethylpyrimidine kinase/phosphomethylpyrimidine kinase [Candidatus Methanospirare jalkutatii]UYZ40357.1 MAG: bifunctional hydroxymethylpyrimidine kinase/phosphomethylpyrimidine kinase [Candidatus Methanospirare jalkutatii]